MGTPGGAPATGKTRAPSPPEAAAPRAAASPPAAKAPAAAVPAPEEAAATAAADALRLAAWATQIPSTGLVLLRAHEITIANQAFTELSHSLRGPLVLHQISTRADGEAPVHFDGLADAVIAEERGLGARLVEPSHRRFHALGDDRWVELVLERVAHGQSRDGEGFTMALVRDITSQVTAEAELVAAQDVLARQQHMSAIGELTAGIVHDVSNTLGAIRLRLSALRREPACMAAQGPNIEALERIVSDGTTMMVKLQRLGQSSNLESPESVDLVESIAAAVEIAQSGLRYRAIHDGVDIRIERDLPPLPRINAWPDDLQRMFVNLLINSRDAMPRGGRIRISGSVVDEQIIIRIEDDGMGIAPGAMPRIFEPYFTTKGGGGNGMGLTMAQRSLARLGGSIVASNQQEGGARFTLRFPTGGVLPESDSGPPKP